MKLWKEVILYIGAFFLQPFLYHLLPGEGISPNLILVLTVMLTFLYDDDYYAIGLGTIFSLMIDLCYGIYIGPAGVAILVVGVVVFFIKGFVNKENIVNGGIVILLSTWIYGSFYWLVYVMSGNHSYSYFYAMKSLPLQLLYNLIVALIMYMILIKKVTKHRKDRYFR